LQKKNINNFKNLKTQKHNWKSVKRIAIVLIRSDWMKKIGFLLLVGILLTGCIVFEQKKECYSDNKNFVLSDFYIEQFDAGFIIENESGTNVNSVSVKTTGDLREIALKIVPEDEFENATFITVTGISTPFRGEQYSGTVELTFIKSNGKKDVATIYCSGTVK